MKQFNRILIRTHLKLRVTQVHKETKAPRVVKYLGCAIDSIRVFLLAGGQSNMGDRLHWVCQGQQHLALLNTQERGGPTHINLTLTPKVFYADVTGMQGWSSFNPPHVGSRLHAKDELGLRKQRKEQMPLIRSRAFTGLRKKAPEKEVGMFLRSPCSIFKWKLDLSAVASVNSSSPTGTI